MDNQEQLLYKHNTLNPMSNASKYTDDEKWVTVINFKDGITVLVEKHESEDVAKDYVNLLIQEMESRKILNIVTLSPIKK